MFSVVLHIAPSGRSHLERVPHDWACAWRNPLWRARTALRGFGQRSRLRTGRNRNRAFRAGPHPARGRRPGRDDARHPRARPPAGAWPCRPGAAWPHPRDEAYPHSPAGVCPRPPDEACRNRPAWACPCPADAWRAVPAGPAPAGNPRVGATGPPRRRCHRRSPREPGEPTFRRRHPMHRTHPMRRTPRVAAACRRSGSRGGRLRNRSAPSRHRSRSAAAPRSATPREPGPGNR